MGCNCGKQVAPVKYVHIAPDGTRTEYTSEVQAAAAKVRKGGRYTSVSK